MTDKTDSKEREDFEAWFSSDGKWPRSVERNGDCYKLIQAQQAWDAFQAGRASVHIDLEDMATAEARGFRDGVASLAASAGSEPVAWRIDWPDEPYLGHYFSEAPTDSGRCQPLYTHPSPPEGMVMAPKEPTEAMLEAVEEEVGGHCYSCSKWRASYDDCRRIWAAMIAAIPPTSSADSSKEQP